MPKVKFELNREGVRELLRSGEMMNVCRGYADRAAAVCGDGYSVNTYTGRNRVNAEIKAETFKARKDNLENNTILKSLGG